MKQLKLRRLLSGDLTVRLISWIVLLYGIVVLVDVLGIRLVGRSLHHTNDASLSISLIAGLSLVYLSTRLRRRKRTAFWVTVIVYSALCLANCVDVLLELEQLDAAIAVRRIVLPLLIITLLVYRRSSFKVRSDIQSFQVALRAVALVWIVSFLFGVVGFMTMDERAFHKDIGVVEAAHRTVDQLGLTTDDTLIPHTRRAKLFLDALSVVSAASIAYAGISLFRPFKSLYSTERTHMELAQQLLEKSAGSDSEDFFKLWPTDKHYFFTDNQLAGLAYRVQKGVALVVGDPFGQKKYFATLISDFLELCELNDWQPALVHVTAKHRTLYQKHRFALQKIGEEAIINIDDFLNGPVKGKYFRQIGNRFTKQGYSSELLQPPHDRATIERLQVISDGWLSLPGREERGFMLGYFNEAYIQQGPVLVLRDSEGTIQAFMNQVYSYDKHEANYDLLRNAKTALGNSNDFLVTEFIRHAKEAGFIRLNLGLCPLSGLDNDDEGRTVIDNALQFVYSNGDRFYSFSGLRKFKAKYEPEWSPRYIAYQGGIRGFTRTLTALNGAMKIKKPNV